MKAMGYRKPSAEMVRFLNEDIIATSPGSEDLLSSLLGREWHDNGNGGREHEFYDGIYVRYKNGNKKPGSEWTEVGTRGEWTFWKKN